MTAEKAASLILKADEAYDEYARLYRIAEAAKRDADAAYYRWFAARQQVPVQSRWPQKVER